MKNRLSWFLAFAVLGACLCVYTQPAAAQQSTPAPDPGQQGELNNENVDTGAAANLDTGAVENVETGAVENVDTDAVENVDTGAVENVDTGAVVTAATSVIPAGVSATGSGSVEDLGVEGDFDLQEIAGTDIPEPN